MSFEFTAPTTAALDSVTPRTEKHGDADVFAITLGLRITGVNTLLDKLSPTLREALYKPADDRQTDLPEVETATPLLRATGIEELKLKGELNGWTIAVAHGIDEDPPIKLGDAKVDRFRVRPMQGGTIELLFRVGSSDIDAAEAGLLCAKLHQEIDFTLTAPIPKADTPKTESTGAAIDGTTEAFRRDHPETPEDLFAASVAGDESGERDPDMDGMLPTPGPDDPDDPDDAGEHESDGEGDAPDLEQQLRDSLAAGDAQDRAEQERQSPGWPFPSDGALTDGEVRAEANAEPQEPAKGRRSRKATAAVE